MIPRRHLLVAAGAALLPPPARATPAEVAALIRELTGGAAPRPGRVKLEIPVLVENGNAVSMTVSANAPVRSIHVFAEANPNPNVITLHFGPASGAPRFATRIRLATSQTVIAVAQAEDGFWMDSVELLVTLAACLE
jgi:sulfur-oxidizing protein SoxY